MSRQQEFLFINKNENSAALSNSRGDLAQSISRHVQLRYLKNRRLQKKKALRSTSGAVEKIRTVGWRQQNTDATTENVEIHEGESPTTRDETPVGVDKPSPRGVDSSSEDSSTEEGKLRIDDRRIIRWLCGKGGAVDPFTSTAMSVDSNSIELVPFFTEWWKHTSWGWTWGRWQGSESVVAITVKRSMLSESHMLSLLTYTVMMKDTVQPGSMTTNSKASIQTKTLLALQEQVRSDSVVASDLLFDVSFVCLAAVFSGDGNAATMHLNAIKVLVGRLGGLEMVPAYLAELFLFSDYRVSISNLTPPLFNIAGALTSKPPEPWAPTRTLATSERAVLRSAVRADSQLPLRFLKVASEVIKCAQILESVWANPETLMNAYWTKWKALTLVTSLTTLDLPASDVGSADYFLKIETTRISLLLWVSVLLSTTLLQAGGIQFLPYLKIEAIRRYEKPIQDFLLRWNRAYEESAYLKVSDTDTPFPKHRRIIREFEAQGFVELSDFMDEFFALEHVHRGRRASKQERLKITKAVEHSFKSAMGQNWLMFTWQKDSPRTSVS